MIGQTISHYKILEKLGEGGMGVVYRAEDLKLKRTVALKFLPPELTRDKSAKTRFIHEAQAASALQHHNICTIHEIDETKNGRLFIAMDCYEGETLKDRVSRGPLPVGDAVNIALQISDGLSEAHRAGMVHRDIKPANIILTQSGVVKILDFGLAKLAGMTKVTKTGTTVGTVAYMSPEQARGDDIDQRSDIWSLGAVLYELLTGHLPFPGNHDAAVLYGIMHNDPEPIPKYRSDVPERLVSVIGHMLEKSPGERYSSMSDAKADLEAICGAAVVPRGPRALGSGVERQIKLARRSILLTATLVILAGLIVTMLLSRTHTPETAAAERALSVVDFTNLIDPNDPTISPGITGLVRVGLVESSPVRVISPEYLLEVRRRSFNKTQGQIEAGEVLEIARRAGATMLLSGQIGKSGGEQYALWQLVDVSSGRSVASSRVRGKDVMELADHIVAGALGVITEESGLASETSSSVSSLATASPEAYRYYVAGTLAAGDAYKIPEAIQDFKKAVEIDTTFALAFVALAKTLDNIGESESRGYAEKAWNLRKQLGVKDRMVFEAWMQARIAQDYQESISTYEEVLSRWPDDRDVLESLVYGYLYFHRVPDVLNIAERALVLYPDDEVFGTQYQRSLDKMGKIDEALKASRNYVTRHPGNSDAWDDLGLRFLSAGLPDSAEACFRHAKTIKPDDSGLDHSLALCAYFRGDANGAADAFERILSKHRDLVPFFRVQFLVGTIVDCFGLAEMYAEAGRFDMAMQCFDRVSQDVDPNLEKQVFGLRNYLLTKIGRAQEAAAWCRSDPGCSAAPFMLAFAALAVDSTEVARAVLSKLREREEDFGYKARRSIRLIAAKIALSDHDPETALSFLGELQQFGVNPLSLSGIERRQIKAQAYFMAGRADDAVHELRELSRIYGGNALSHYQLAQMFESMKRPADAKAEYAKFLEMWSEADADLPQLKDARTRLAALNSRT